MADHRDKHGQGGPPGEDDFSLDEILAEFATPRHRSKTAKKLVERTLPDNILLFPGRREVDEGPDLITPPRPAPKAPAAPLSKAPPPADPEEEPEATGQGAQERPAPVREKAPHPLPRQPEAREGLNMEQSRAEVEKSLIIDALSKTRSLRQAGELLHVSASTLSRKIRQYGIDYPRARS